MQLSTGLFTNMVLQRNRAGFSCTPVSGICSASGTLFMAFSKGKKAVGGKQLTKIGTARGGIFKGTLATIPVGGPYAVTLAIGNQQKNILEKITVKNILVGDVWILAGQSNMEGIGYIRDRQKPHALVRAFYMDDTWNRAVDPLHELNKAVDPAHEIIAGGPIGSRAKHIGTGPGVAFGQELFKKIKVPQGLIACAHGGTSMMQWSPAAGREQGNKSLYGAMLRRIQVNGGRVAGLFWYQGCSDANEQAHKVYTDAMKTFAAQLRRDLHAPALPIVAVQIASVAAHEPFWNSIQEQQRTLPRQIKHLAVVPAIDLDLDDLIHVCGRDQNLLGRRAAEAMGVLTGADKHALPPIELQSVKVLRNPDQPAEGMVVVTYKNVAGALVAPGKPWGFEVVDNVSGSMSSPCVYRIQLDGCNAIIRTTLTYPILMGSFFLHYGLGVRPYCNVVDRAGRSLPAMGPISLTDGRLCTSFITKLEVSPLEPMVQSISDLLYPSNRAFAQRTFTPGYLCMMRQDFLASAIDDPLVYYRIPLQVNEEMKLEISLGYDGPLKAWFDRREILCNPDKVNPANPGDSVVAIAPGVGDHELVIALGSNKKLAWGVFVQFFRTGIAPEKVLKNPNTFAMPTILV